MNSSTNVPYWTVVLRVGCVLSQVIAGSGDLPLKLNLTPNIVVHLPEFYKQLFVTTKASPELFAPLEKSVGHS